MKTADITLIADRWCPTSRTNCTYLRESGFVFKKIILVDFLGQNQKLRFLRHFTGMRLAHRLAIKKRPAWPDYEGYKDYFRALQPNTEYCVDYLNPFDYSQYSDDIENFVAEDYQDPLFQSFLKKQNHKVFLYTNGGIVTHELLDYPDIRILHIHPGIVPEVRGSDGLLWSILVKKRPGVSCFYMDAGIDTGNLIAQKEFDLPCINVGAPTTAEEEDILYRALLIAYDPHLRASMLRDIVVAHDGKGLGALKTSDINNKSSESYLWMHPQMRQRVISGLCKG